jgi:hypothetical protein
VLADDNLHRRALIDQVCGWILDSLDASLMRIFTDCCDCHSRMH